MHWSSLPVDVLSTIAQHCSPDTLSRIRLVCRHWRRAVNESFTASSLVGSIVVGKDPEEEVLVRAVPAPSFCPHITTLQLYSVEITPSWFLSLSSCPNLCSLRLESCELKGDALRLIPAFTSLRHLCLSSSKFTEESTLMHLSTCGKRWHRSYAAITPPEGNSTDSTPGNSEPAEVRRDYSCLNTSDIAANGSRTCAIGSCAEQEFGVSNSSHGYWSLLSIDISGVKGISNSLLEQLLRRHRYLTALAVSVSQQCCKALQQAARLPYLRHLDISSLDPHSHKEYTELPAVLTELCEAAARRPPGLLEASDSSLARLQDEAPWWRAHAITRQSERGAARRRAQVKPEVAFHLCIDLPLLFSTDRDWISDSFGLIPRRALTVRGSNRPDDCENTFLSDAVSSEHSRMLHRVLPLLADAAHPVSHLGLVGIELTESLIRSTLHLRQLQPLSLTLGSTNPNKVNSAPHCTTCDSPCSRTSADKSPSRDPLSPQSSRHFGNPEASPIRSPHARQAALAARWRRPSASILRQLLGLHSTLRNLSLANFSGLNDTVLQRLRSHEHLRHLEISGECSATLEGLKELRWMPLSSLHLRHLHNDPAIAAQALCRLCVGGPGLASTLTWLSFEGFDIPSDAVAAQLRSVSRLRKLARLSLDDTSVRADTAGTHREPIAVAAERIVAMRTLERISVNRSSLSEEFWHTSLRTKSRCVVESAFRGPWE